MNQISIRRGAPRFWVGYMGTLFMLISSLALSGCARPTQGTGLAQASSPVTSTNTPVGTPTLSRPELDATKIAALDAPEYELQTRIASGTPFVFTPIPVPSQQPVRTPVLGISGNCAQGNHQFDYGGCWAGLVNNEYIFVDTGALMSDPTQGVVRVFTSTMALATFSAKQDYPTPSRAGRVHPVQVVWPVMTLTTLDVTPPVIFTFDISTRQWISPTPSATPSPTP